MRISGGSLCGRNVTCPPGIIRPAMDRMRQSFFSILGPLDGLSFLDVFSGSGCMGLEAFSRGARPVRCVEKDPGKRRVILENLRMADDGVKLSLMPAERFIASWKEGFDLVFLDPPFDYPWKPDLLQKLADSRLLKDGGRVFIHFPSEDALPARFDGRHFTLEQTDCREYGRSIINFLEARQHSSPAVETANPESAQGARPPQI